MADVQKIVSELRQTGFCPMCSSAPAEAEAGGQGEQGPLELVEVCEHEAQEGLDALDALGIGICIKCNLAFGVQ